MERLFTAWKLKNLEIQNRICVPPMVCFGWSDESGMVVDKNVEHYRAMAKGGPLGSSSRRLPVSAKMAV